MSEDVKIRILDAATHLFAKQGFAGTSVRQICEEAGANVALVSYHFGGKEKLFSAVLDSAFPERDLFQQVEQIADPIERLKEMIKQFVLFTRSHMEVGRIFMNEIMMHTERMEMLRTYTYTVWRLFRQALAEAREQGRLHFDSLDQAQLQLMGTLIYPIHSHFISPMLDNPQPEAHDVEIRERTRYILRGLGAHPIDIE